MARIVWRQKRAKNDTEWPCAKLSAELNLWSSTPCCLGLPPVRLDLHHQQMVHVRASTRRAPITGKSTAAIAFASTSSFYSVLSTRPRCQSGTVKLLPFSTKYSWLPNIDVLAPCVLHIDYCCLVTRISALTFTVSLRRVVVATSAQARHDQVGS